MRLSRNLKKLRNKRNLSVKFVSSALNIPESTYRGYEYGSKIPADLVPGLCKLFNINMQSFFEEDYYLEIDSEDVFYYIDLIEKGLAKIRKLLADEQSNC